MVILVLLEISLAAVYMVGVVAIARGVLYLAGRGMKARSTSVEKVEKQNHAEERGHQTGVIGGWKPKYGHIEAR